MNPPAKDKPGYWLKKLLNMRKAKVMRGPNMRQAELREEEAWRLGFKRKSDNAAPAQPDRPA